MRKVPAAKQAIRTAVSIHGRLTKLEGEVSIRDPWNRVWWEMMVTALEQELTEIKDKLQSEAQPPVRLVENPVAIPDHFQRTKYER